MLKKKRRGFSILLALCMVVSLLPVSASAAVSTPVVVESGGSSLFFANETPITIMANPADGKSAETVIKYNNEYAKITGTDVETVSNPQEATNVSGYIIYGGRSGGNSDSTSITMESGSVKTIWGGNNNSETSVGTVELTIKGGTVENVYGTVCDATNLNIAISGNATIGTFHGVSGDDNVSKLNITISGSPTFNGDVYIGPSGTLATVTDLLCTISGGSFNGDIYGGYIGNNNNGKIQLNSDIEIQSGKEFDTVDKATGGVKVAVEVASGVTVTNRGTINWYNNAVNKGTIDNYGLIEGCMINDGIINNYHTINGSYNNDQHLTNNGTINNCDSGLLAETIKNEGTINNYDAYIDVDATIVGKAVTEFYPVTLLIFETADGVVPTGADDRQDSGKGHGAYWAEENNEYTIDLRNEEGINYDDPRFNPDNCKLSKNINVIVEQTLLAESQYEYDRTKGILTIYEGCITGEVGIDAVLIPKTTLGVTAPTFDEVTYGYSQPEAKAITITNTGKSIAYIDSIELSGENVDAFTLDGTKPETLAAGATDSTSLTLQPKKGLAAGTYTATITITYDNGETATAEVSFTVNKKTQLAPATPPQMANSTTDTITLTPMADNPISGAPVEYSIDHGKTWTTNNIFTGLQAGTQYGFMVRYAAIEGYEASPATELVNFTTQAVQTDNNAGSVDSSDSEGKKTDKSDNSSATGDDSNMLPWIILASTSLMMVAGMLVRRRGNI